MEIFLTSFSKSTRFTTMEKSLVRPIISYSRAFPNWSKIFLAAVPGILSDWSYELARITLLPFPPETPSIRWAISKSTFPEKNFEFVNFFEHFYRTFSRFFLFVLFQMFSSTFEEISYGKLFRFLFSNLRFFTSYRFVAKKTRFIKFFIGQLEQLLLAWAHRASGKNTLGHWESHGRGSSNRTPSRSGR